MHSLAYLHHVPATPFFSSRFRNRLELAICLALGVLFSAAAAWAAAPVPPGGIPASVLLFEQQKHRLPKSTFDLNLCTLLARGPRHKVFPGLPSDRGPATCDLSHVYLAYDGFCAAGVRDKKGGVHFSQSLMPMITIREYSNGIVIEVNNVLKFDTITTAEDEQAAVEYFSREHAPEAVHDVRGGQLDIFPTEWAGEIPLKKRVP